MGNSVQKKRKNGAFCLVNKQRNSQRANKIREIDRANHNETKWRPLLDDLERTRSY